MLPFFNYVPSIRAYFINTFIARLMIEYLSLFRLLVINDLFNLFKLFNKNIYDLFFFNSSFNIVFFKTKI